MTGKTLLMVHSVIYAIFGLALFFGAEQLWPLYGLQVNDKYALFLSQHNSIFLGGVAILAFLHRNIVTAQFVKGLLWTNLLGVAITLYACLTGIFVGFGWSDPIFFSLMAVLCLWALRSNLSEDQPNSV